MKLLSKISLRKLLNNKKFCVCISLVLAFVFWLSIVANQTPVIERTITNIPIIFETEGTIAGDYKLEVVNYTGTRTAEAKVSGPAYVVSRLTADDIEVRLDVSAVSEPGEYNIQVRASQKAVNSEYSIISVTPSSLKLRYDRISEKTVNFSDIVAEANVKPAEGYIIGNKAVSTVSSNALTISGPRTEVDKITTVKAVANITDSNLLSAAKTYDADILLYDEDGEQLDSSLFTLSTAKTQVYVTVYKTKSVEITVEIDNAPRGIKESYTKKLTVMGAADAIDSAPVKANHTVDYNKIQVENDSFKLALTDMGFGTAIMTADGENFITVPLK